MHAPWSVMYDLHSLQCNTAATSTTHPCLPCELHKVEFTELLHKLLSPALPEAELGLHTSTFAIAFGTCTLICQLIHLDKAQKYISYCEAGQHCCMSQIITILTSLYVPVTR